MRSAEERIGAVLVLRHELPIDRDHSPEIEAWVDDKLAQGEKYLVLHCGKVTCFDSVGLETILAVTRQVSSQGARFALAHLGQDCATTLRVTRLESAIEHYLSVEDAVRALRGTV